MSMYVLDNLLPFNHVNSVPLMVHLEWIMFSPWYVSISLCNVLFSIQVSHPYVAIGRMQVHTIIKLLFVAVLIFSLSTNIFACHFQAQFGLCTTFSIILGF